MLDKTVVAELARQLQELFGYTVENLYPLILLAIQLNAVTLLVSMIMFVVGYFMSLKGLINYMHKRNWNEDDRCMYIFAFHVIYLIGGSLLSSILPFMFLSIISPESALIIKFLGQYL